MSQQQWLVVLKPAFDQRFKELTVMAKKQGAVQSFRQEQYELTEH